MPPQNFDNYHQISSDKDVFCQIFKYIDELHNDIASLVRVSATHASLVLDSCPKNQVQLVRLLKWHLITVNRADNTFPPTERFQQIKLDFDMKIIAFSGQECMCFLSKKIRSMAL